MEVNVIPTDSATIRQRQEAYARAQLESGKPWPRKWNVLIGKPGAASVRRHCLIAAVFLVQAAIGLFTLAPGLGTQSDTSFGGLAWFWVAMFPFACAFAWSALRLHKFNSESSP